MTLSHKRCQSLIGADSAFFGHPTIGAAVRGGTDVSITTGLNSVIRSAIGATSDDAWTPIECTHAVFNEGTQWWISVAEVPEIPFASQKKAPHVPGRLIVRRIPDLRRQKDQGQRQLFEVWVPRVLHHRRSGRARHRCSRHAIIEQVHADLKNSALAYLPSSRLTTNAAWLVSAVTAFNRTRAGATLTADPATGRGRNRG